MIYNQLRSTMESQRSHVMMLAKSNKGNSNTTNI